MSEITQWLADLALLPEMEIERWQPFRHQHERRQCGAAELPALLAALGEVSGWLVETGRVRELRRQPVEVQGLPLDGEFFRGDSHWQLQHLGRDRWELHHHQLHRCAAHEASHLGEHVHQRHADGGCRLNYWRLWARARADGLPQCELAVLFSIEESRA